MELIDRSEVQYKMLEILPDADSLEWYEQAKPEEVKELVDELYNIVMDAKKIDAQYFSDCPLADVRPMKRGKLVDTNTDLMPMHRYDEFTDPQAVFWAKCSSCNITVNQQGVAGGWRYCSHCGADMRGVDNESNP